MLFSGSSFSFVLCFLNFGGRVWIVVLWAGIGILLFYGQVWTSKHVVDNRKSYTACFLLFEIKFNLKILIKKQNLISRNIIKIKIKY